MPTIEKDIKLEFRDVLFKPKRSNVSSRSKVDLHWVYSFKNSKRLFSGIPLMASNKDPVGTFEMAKVFASHKLFTCINEQYSVEAWKQFATESRLTLPYIAVSIGLVRSEEEVLKLNRILKAVPEVSVICVDVPNGYLDKFIDLIKTLRRYHPTHTIIAGNVVTGDQVRELIMAGADVIKIGIGPGAMCCSRLKCGVGYPQLSAVLECAGVAHKLKGHIICDGGCSCPGDVCKAFGAGADFVMIGGMLMGHDEAGGEMIERNGKKMKQFYGHSSPSSIARFEGNFRSYSGSDGITLEIPYCGPVEMTIQDILSGLRSTCTYIGAFKLTDLPKNTTFIRINSNPNDNVL